MPLIIPSNSISGEFEVANSLRFDDGSSDSLTKSFGSAGNRSVWTWSAWLKFSTFYNFHPIFTAGDWSGGSTATGFILYLGQFYTYWNSPAGGTSTTAKFRDTSAWYHVVLQANTSTLKLYVNSVEQSSKSISGSGEINNSSSEHGLGKYSNTTSAFFDGYMAEVCFIDGQALDPTSFGEFDEDTGIWKPIDVSGLTFGTNGFYLDFENSGSLGADVSGNGNNFTVNNLTAIDQSTDTCTNNFATLNALFPQSNQTLSEGNLKATNSTGTYNFRPATIGVSSGKWYAEYKITTNTNHMHGVVDLAFAVAQGQNGYTHCGAGTGGVGYYADGQKYVEDSNSAYGNSYGDGDIIGIALDMDNNAVYFSKNGTFQNSGDPTSGASKTGAISLPTTGTYTFAETVISSCIVECNFGSPAFSISSGNSDGNGYGNFEYSVPSGYYALNTKNLAEYG